MKTYAPSDAGSGLHGAAFACFAQKAGKKCPVIGKRPHLYGRMAECKCYDSAHVVGQVMKRSKNPWRKKRAGKSGSPYHMRDSNPRSSE